MTFDLDGLDRLHEKITKEGLDRLEHIHMTITELFHGKANEYCPKDDGTLAGTSSIRYQRNMHSKIVFEQKYALYVEYGTPSMTAAHGPHDPRNPVTVWRAKTKRNAGDNQMMPYVRPAMYWIRDNIRQVTNEALRTLPR